MDIAQCYRLLMVENTASDADISKAFRALALKYHPDKNPHNREWANEQMTLLNTAYSAVMSYRFKNDSAAEIKKDDERPSRADVGRQEQKRRTDAQERSRSEREAAARFHDEKKYDELVNRFVMVREDAKDAMYKYFQYGLYNFHRRDDVKGQGLYHGIVMSLRKAYQRIKKLSELTSDKEMLDHFAVFSKMIFDFYRSSECLNIIDSYNDRYEVDAWRMYRKGDELLHQAHRELFFDRHNRGSLARNRVFPDLNDAEMIFRKTIRAYPDSSWAVETAIKLDYVLSLKAYYDLFFSGE